MFKALLEDSDDELDAPVGPQNPQLSINLGSSLPQPTGEPSPVHTPPPPRQTAAMKRRRPALRKAQVARGIRPVLRRACTPGYVPPAFGHFRYTGAATASGVPPLAQPSYAFPQPRPWQPAQWQPVANAGRFLVTPDSDEPAAKRHQVTALTKQMLHMLLLVSRALETMAGYGPDVSMPSRQAFL